MVGFCFLIVSAGGTYQSYFTQNYKTFFSGFVFVYAHHFKLENQRKIFHTKRENLFEIKSRIFVW